MRHFTVIGAGLLIFTLVVTIGIFAAPSLPRTLVLPAPDPELQLGLEAVLNQPPFRQLVRRQRLSVALVDLSGPELRFAGMNPDNMLYAASLPKIAVLLALFEEIEAGRLEYTPDLKDSMIRMIRFSSNREASRLIALVGFERIAQVLRDPQYELYDPGRKGGLWVGKDYGGSLGRWKRDPLYQISHGATARQVARFLVMMDRGLLVSPWASREMKEIMSRPGIHHKFVKGLMAGRPGSRIFRKSGTWQNWHSDAAIVERDGRRYVAVALMESSTKNVLARLIVKLDDLIRERHVAADVTGRQPDDSSQSGEAENRTTTMGPWDDLPDHDFGPPLWDGLQGRDSGPPTHVVQRITGKMPVPRGAISPLLAGRRSRAGSEKSAGAALVARPS